MDAVFQVRDLACFVESWMRRLEKTELLGDVVFVRLVDPLLVLGEKMTADVWLTVILAAKTTQPVARSRDDTTSVILDQSRLVPLLCPTSQRSLEDASSRPVVHAVGLLAKRDQVRRDVVVFFSRE